MKIAITSSNGKEVDTHFGQAKFLYVYELSPVLSFIEKRECEKYCSADSNHEFKPQKFDLVYDKIKDCDVLYTAKIGDTPLAKLLNKGLKVIEYKGGIEKIFEI